MKNFLLAVLGLFAALPLCAANNIKMVTYFPVPYASYNDLKVSGTCDVGLLDDCTLDAGSSLRVLKDASRTNNEGKLEVLRGALSLNGSGSIYGNTLQFGINSVSGGELQFKHNLNVTTMPGSAITSIQVSNQAKLNKLNLFEKYEFPGCDGTDNEINWKRLTVNGAEGVFLVCGAGKTTEKTCAQDPNQQKCCTGCTTWNGSICQQKTCPGGYTLDSGTCQCKRYQWMRESEEDCVFNPANPSQFYCAGAGSIPGNIVSGADYRCDALTTYGGSNTLFLGAAGTCNKTDCGACSADSEGKLGYVYSDYGGLSLGAKYSMGCVAYKCMAY